MGIFVDQNKCVLYDANNHHLIDSRPSKNPIIQSVLDFEVVSVFRRVKMNTNTIDGNPLIYALKAARGYSIDRRNIGAFMPEFNSVLGKLKSGYASDFVVPVPSGSKVSAMFAKRVARIIGGVVKDEWLAKKFNRDVRQDIDMLLRHGSLSSQQARAMKSVSADLGRSLFTVFSMKLIDASIRHHFDPIRFAKGAQIPKAGSVLLVDDLLSTGTSLASAGRLLRQQGLDVRYMCLLSSTGAYKFL